MKGRIYLAALTVVAFLLIVISVPAPIIIPPQGGGGGGGTSLSITGAYAPNGAIRINSTNISIAPVYVWNGQGPNTNAPTVILDMDYGGDVDDAMDLLLASILHKLGLINLASVTHSSSNDWGSASISAALWRYGLSIPVGMSKVPTGVTTDVYGSYVATNYYSPSKFWFTNALDAKDVMRHVLANSANSNVLIITTGPLNNLQRLIDSTSDGISSLSGSQLLVQKLRPDLGIIPVVNYFTNTAGNLNGPEFNSSAHLNALVWVNTYVANSFPVTFFGEEVFETVQTGLGYQTNMSQMDPAYSAFNLAGVSSRPAWAQGALMLAALGTNWTYGSAKGSNVFGFSGGGTNQITAGGSNIWWNGTYVGQKYVIRVADTNWLSGIVNSLVMPAINDSKDFARRRGGEVYNGGINQYTNGARIYLESNPNSYVSQIYARNNASVSGVMTLQDFTASAASHFFFGQHEDNYLRGGRNQTPDNGYNFFNTIAGDNNNIFGNGANTSTFNSVVIISNVAPSRVLMTDANNRLTNVFSSSPSTEYLHPDGSAGTPAGGSGGTNNPAVLLQAGNTNLTGQSGNITAHYQATNGSHGIDFDLAVPVSGQTFRNFETNSAGTNYVVTFYTNGVAGKFYNPESLTNETSYIVPAGALTMAEFVSTTPGNWTLTRHVQPVLRPVFSTGLSVVTNGVNGLDAVITATSSGGGANATNLYLFADASTNAVIDVGAASTNHLTVNYGMLTNTAITISNWSFVKFPVRFLFKQDTNGNRSITSLRSTDGLIVTNGFLRLDTNASATTEWVLRADYSTSLPATNVIITSGGSGELLNTATNLMVVGTRYTNGFRRSFVSASFSLSAAVAGTAAVAMYVERTGVTNRLAISAGPLASLVTIEPLIQMVGPGEIYYFTDETSGSGATAAIVANTSSKVDL